MLVSRNLLKHLSRASDGAAAVEFAVVAPTFMMLMLGLFDVGQMFYAKSVLEGAVQSAARLSALETGDTDEADAMVEGSVKPIIPGVELQASRVSYFDFSDIKRPEKWNDDKDPDEVEPEDGDGVCNNSEGYTDENNNGSWDDDIGQEGNGGASDVVIYTVTITYSPTFKIPFTPKSWDDRTLTSTAVRKNQPFANQASYSTKAGTCT